MNYGKIFRSRFFSHSPFRLVHDITYECNCKCMICERWKQIDSYKNPLTCEENFNMLQNAKNAGVILYVVEGGEPLLYRDLPQVLRYAKQLGFATTVITNGYLLKQRSKEILPFTDSIVVSIDSNDDLHDEMRGCKGLRQRAIEGIQQCKNSKTQVTINCVLCKHNTEKIDGMLMLSKELALPIIFQPMDIYKGYNENLGLTQQELRKTFSNIFDRKKEGYQIVNSYSYLQHLINNTRYVCHAPKCFTYVKPNGNIVSCCDITERVWGNVKNNQFKEIFRSKEFKTFCRTMESCNKCSIHAVIDTSLLYSLHPRSVIETIASEGSTLFSMKKNT